MKINSTSIISHSPAIFMIVFFASIPWSIAVMQISAGLAVLSLLVKMIYLKENLLSFHRFYIFIAIYIFFQMLSAGFSKDPGRSFAAVFHTDWFILLVPFIGLIQLSEKLKRILTYTLFTSAVIAGILAIFQFFYGVSLVKSESLNPMGDFFRAEGAYNFYLTFAGNQLMILGLVTSFYLVEKKWNRNRYFYMFSFLIIFLSIISTFARSTWLAMVIIMLVSSWFINRRLFWLLSSGVVLMTFFFSLLNPEIYNRIVSIFNVSHLHNSGRINLWLTSWEMFKDYPILGIGTGFFNEYFPIYKIPGYYDAFGHAHNDYLNFAVNSGIVGFVSWSGMWISWFYFVSKILFREKISKIDFKILMGALLAVFGILLAAFFQCYYTDLENNILWWGIVALSLSVMNSMKNVEKS